MNPFSENNAVIVTHEATTGPAHELRDYLISKVKILTFIAHPLLFIPSTRKKRSYCEEYVQENKISRKDAPFLKGPEPFLYLKDCFYSFFWIFFSSKKYDFYVGSGNINAFVGLILKKLRKVKKVIFYCIDYVPVRFQNRLLNKFYHWIDRVCYRSCDFTWNLSERMIEAREKLGLRREPKHLVVPHGVHFKRIERLPFDQINKTEIVYMGTLLEKQGIQHLIQALPVVCKEIPEITFTIIGEGPYEKELKELVSSLGLDQRVRFLGYIEDHKVVEKVMTKAALAVALYDPLSDNFSYYADPGKVKNYLAAGLPVLITDVPAISKQIVRERCGEIVPLEKDKIAQAIIRLLKSQDVLSDYRKKAIEFSSNYEWGSVLKQATSSLL